MIYLLMAITVIASSILIYFSKKILDSQQTNHIEMMALLYELNTLQSGNVDKYYEKLRKGQISTIEEIAPLYDLANSHANADLYFSELREENQKLKKILKRKSK